MTAKYVCNMETLHFRRPAEIPELSTRFSLPFILFPYLNVDRDVHPVSAVTMGSNNEPAATALKDLRETLRAPASESDVDSFAFQLSSTLEALCIQQTSIAPSRPDDIIRAVQRHLTSAQLALLTHGVPTYFPALEARSRALLETFFIPPSNADPAILAISRAVILASYSTLTHVISSPSSSSPTSPIALPPQSREYVFQTLEKLSRQYNIDALYWGVWGQGWGSDGDIPAESSNAGSMKTLKWEEVVRAAISVPAKVANLWGKWKEEGWQGDVPASLRPR